VASVKFDSKIYEIEEGESVLDSLLRNDIKAKYSCKAGLCHACVLRADQGGVPESSQRGISDNQKAMNYFLACQCHPENDLCVSAVDQAARFSKAKVVNKEMLSPTVLGLKLFVNFDFKPGQFVTLWRDGNVGRSYSIASLPEEHLIECHIKIVESGAYSSWAKDSLRVDDVIEIQGPLGECFYQADLGQSLLLSAIGTGLSPILGILRDALSKGHHGRIDLILGGMSPESFYLVEELKLLEQQHSNIKIHFVCQSQVVEFAEHGDIYQYALSQFADLKGYKVYLCGAPTFVQRMTKQCFLNGAAMTDISSDAFVHSVQ